MPLKAIWFDEEPFPPATRCGRSKKWNRRRAAKRQRLFAHRSRRAQLLFNRVFLRVSLGWKVHVPVTAHIQ